MKPRIFIHMRYMALGGAERALLGLLNSLNPEKVDIDLFLNQHTGEFMTLIPKYVNLLPEVIQYKSLETHIKQGFRDGCWMVAFARIVAKLQKKLYFAIHRNEKDDDGFFAAKCTAPFLPQINSCVKYDLAISFITPHVVTLKKVNAKRKLSWIHTDYATLHLARRVVLPIWRQYDNIISISPDVSRTFVNIFPELEEKIIEIENIISPEFVRQQAEITSELIQFQSQVECLASDIKILSIGRFCYAKNYDNVPDIASRIVEAGYKNLKWYLIGFGTDEELIRQKIKLANMENHVIILGKKENPYPYIKLCDLYVQPSRYEGKSITVREAQMLCKPVIVTAYPTSSSQIHDGVDGIIVPMDNANCAKGIIRVIADSNLQQNIIEHLRNHDYGNESEVEKIYKMLS